MKTVTLSQPYACGIHKNIAAFKIRTISMLCKGACFPNVSIAPNIAKESYPSRHNMLYQRWFTALMLMNWVIFALK